MKLLVVGSGGREHAIAWKLAQSSQVEVVYVAPGNGGTATETKCQNIDIAATDIEKLIDFAVSHSITFTVVGPEAPLSLGIVDKFLQHGLKIWGSTQYCAQLESSKAFAKDFMIKHNIPTAKFVVFSDSASAKKYLQQQSLPIVIKADGLASGKGVLVAQSLDEANLFIDSIFMDNRFGAAGSKVVIEEFLAGVEASFIVMIDNNKNILAMASSQDHKRLLDGDNGPNTGGMGAYSPAPIVTKDIYERVIHEIIQPAIDGMATCGHKYTGFLYAGLMIDANGNPKTLEFNCRMGDPETQPIMMRLESDFADIVLAGIDGKLNAALATWRPEYAIGVVLATSGYPDNPQLGDIIYGLDTNNNSVEKKMGSEQVKVFHAGTWLEPNGGITTAGGRALCVVALDAKIATAKSKVYNVINSIKFDGMQYRTDIGYQINCE